jgi:hypothetical protein
VNHDPCCFSVNYAGTDPSNHNNKHNYNNQSANK